MSSPNDFTAAAADLERRWSTNPVIRAVNFHNTPRERSRQIEDQLRQLSHSFCSVDERELDAYLATGRWTKPKPGVIVAVYEGYRNGYDVLRPLLERYELVGWFFLITGFLNASPTAQLAYAVSHDIEMTTHEYGDGRYALSWDEVRALDRRHVVACHARNHTALENLSPSTREDEIVGAQLDLTKELGHSVRSFVAYGGPPYGADPATDRLIEKAGFQFVFSNFRIQRLRAWAG